MDNVLPPSVLPLLQTVIDSDNNQGCVMGDGDKVSDDAQPLKLCSVYDKQINPQPSAHVQCVEDRTTSKETAKRQRVSHDGARTKKVLKNTHLEKKQHQTLFTVFDRQMKRQGPAHVECVEDHTIPETNTKRQCMSHVHPEANAPLRPLEQIAVPPQETDVGKTTFASFLAMSLGLA